MKRLIPFALASVVAALPLGLAAQVDNSQPLAVSAVNPAAAPANGVYSNSAEAMAFAQRVAEKHDLPLEQVQDVLGQARFSATAQRLMRPANSATFFKNWRVYRSRFVEPIRINAGVRFWQQHRDTLERAEREFGVPQEVILGILGVETMYGHDMGKFRVLDVLATLSFNFPKTDKRDRSEFFSTELEAFLLQHFRAGTDAREPLGSYAGAMGMGQFMPTSMRSFAVDFDGDGVIDMARSPADAIGSVANYFVGYGWIKDQPALYDIGFDAELLDMDSLMAPDILPTFSVAQMQAKGVVLPPEVRSHKGPLALIELWNGDPSLLGNQKQYYAGTENFYTITRYNNSSYYAMAVLDLGAAIRAKAGF